MTAKIKKGDRVVRKAFGNPDVLLVHNLNEDETVATCGTEQGSKLTIEDIPVDELVPAPARTTDWMG